MLTNKAIRARLMQVLAHFAFNARPTQDGRLVITMPFRSLNASELEHAKTYGLDDVLLLRYARYEEKVWRSVNHALRKTLPADVKRRLSPQETHDMFVYECVSVEEPRIEPYLAKYPELSA